MDIGYIKDLIVDTSVFAAWADAEDLLEIEAYEEDTCFDIHVSRIEAPINISARDIDTIFIEEFNSMDVDIKLTSAYITMGSPEGGTIRVIYKR
jgi:hypothetical protein